MTARLLHWLDLDFWEVGLLFSVAVCAYFIHQASRDTHNPFRFSDVFMEDGKTSLKHVCAMGAFFVSSWIVLHQEVFSRLSAELFGGYMFGWVFAYTAPKVVEKWKGTPTGGSDEQGRTAPKTGP